MPINYQTTEQLRNIIISAFRDHLPEIDPTVLGSMSRGFVISEAIMGRAIIETIRQLEIQLFPQTAQDDFLGLWGGYENLERLAASSAVGPIAVIGTSGTVIPIGTVFLSTTGVRYETTNGDSIQSQNFAVTSITRQSNVAIVTTPSEHNLATGMSVTVSGADQTEYNGTFTITVTALNEFQYNVTGAPITPATGTITYNAVYITMNIQALSTGQDTNLASGAVMSLETAISGVDNAIVQFAGVEGGASEEENEPYRERILLSRASQSGVFTADQIRLAALGVAGNTRAFVVEPENTFCPRLEGFSIQGNPSTPNRYGQVSASSSINIDTTLSLSLFMMPRFDGLATPVDRVLVMKSNTTFGNGWALILDNANRQIKFGNTVGGFSTFTVPLSLENRQIHVAVTFTASANRLYINGELENEVTGYALSDSGTDLFILGNSGLASNTTSSTIDEIRLFSRSLSSDEIVNLYQTGNVDATDMQGYWRLNEGTGTSFADSSGNTNTGTLSNADMWVPGIDQGTAGMRPLPGQVVAYILRDNDPNIIPSQTILQLTKEAIIANGRKPGHMSDRDIFVLAPSPLRQDFVFSSLDPDTPTMRSAVISQLSAFFDDSVDFQMPITEASYLGSIQNTVDPIVNVPLVSFSLTSPVGNIVPDRGQIALLGDVTFSI